MVFLLEDDTYLHLAFVTGHDSKKAMLKCVGYDTRLYERDERLVNTAVIYTADVKKKPNALNIGTLTYDPGVILMADYDGDTTFTELQNKIKSNQELSDTDVLRLVLLPLMSHTMPRYELASSAIALAKTISDQQKKDACIAATFAFASKYLDEEKLENLKEVLEMTGLAKLFIMDERVAIARDMIKDGEPLAKIMKYSRLSESEILKLQEEVNDELQTAT